MVFAIAFDLDTNNTEHAHPKSVTQAYTDIRFTLQRFGFDWKQGSVYTCTNEDLANLLKAMNALKSLPWFAPSVCEIRAFRVEQWSDFSAFMKD
ncbi:MAG: virulence factor [Acidobacteriota bacterium]|nr:virulence factor [Acidobacteriota bacterium]